MEMTKDDPTLNNDDAFEWGTGGELHPAGTFRAKFVSFAKATVRNEKTNEEEPDPYERLRLVFRTKKKMEDGSPFELSRKCKPSFHPNGFMRKVLIALGVEPEQMKPGAFKLSSYLNHDVLITVEHVEREDKSGKYASISGISAIPDDEDDEDAKAAAKAARRKKLEEDDDE